MKYDHILIRYGELALKGRNQRTFINQLQNNIRHQLMDFPEVQVKKTQGRMFILLNGEDPEPIIEKCRRIFGIHSLSLAVKVDNELEIINETVLKTLLDHPSGTTFKVEVRRANKEFPIQSQEMNQKLGAHLLKNSTGYTVDVHDPDVIIKVEIRVEATYITSSVIEGAGGLPVKTAGKTLLMLSGGIDSPVAGYLAMKRGVEIEAVHFHSPPYTSERAKQKVIDLAKELMTFGHQVKIHIVPFTELQQAIFKEIPEAYAMTVMRRMMMRISEAICEKEGILSITIGESLGQVASQTMESMNAINEVTNYPILRPLVAMDKSEIINISKDIGTYDISIRPYEDCCTVFVPKSPKTRPRRDKVNQFEAKMDYKQLLGTAVEESKLIKVNDHKNEEDAFKDLL
ncbi:tRNA 4-thiouridine(8) synthase ThiI [Virgibacillus sp. MSJ-26]|uniref:tRNA uracil 4-sulfurtransferase ThiI n=1 Tax=Virgibacillus sp. MSJ-26 TaxID=2841522 RepID=UPI001C11A6C6|nr:tRNA uracil 4-sulfurtransferase ThiI [Virgibacillus sp. MSJ-26]MBU5468123.1 tRNA 4-thiouridine(8) synthase ThiI [Virgibacillus sp. MSJ-26]